MKTNMGKSKDLEETRENKHFGSVTLPKGRVVTDTKHRVIGVGNLAYLSNSDSLYINENWNVRGHILRHSELWMVDGRE